METQNNQILEYMKKGNSITAQEALDLFGCFRLAARIKDLKDQGKKIDKVMLANNGKRYAKYFMV